MPQWFRKTRPFALVLGIGFYIILYLAMDILSFSLAMIGTYLLFVGPETLVSCVRSILIQDHAEFELKAQA